MPDLVPYVTHLEDVLARERETSRNEIKTLRDGLRWAMSRVAYPSYESEWSTDFVDRERVRYAEVRKLL